MNTTKKIAILIILFLATSFIVGNIFADYKAEKLARNFKDQAMSKVDLLENEYNNLFWQQKVSMAQALLDSNASPEQIDKLLAEDGIYTIRLNKAASDLKDNMDLGYIMWLNSMENSLNSKTKSIIVHTGHY